MFEIESDIKKLNKIYVFIDDEYWGWLSKWCDNKWFLKLIDDWRDKWSKLTWLSQVELAVIGVGVDSLVFFTGAFDTGVFSIDFWALGAVVAVEGIEARVGFGVQVEPGATFGTDSVVSLFTLDTVGDSTGRGWDYFLALEILEGETGFTDWAAFIGAAQAGFAVVHFANLFALVRWGEDEAIFTDSAVLIGAVAGFAVVHLALGVWVFIALPFRVPSVAGFAGQTEFRSAAEALFTAVHVTLIGTWLFQAFEVWSPIVASITDWASLIGAAGAGLTVVHEAQSLALVPVSLVASITDGAFQIGGAQAGLAVVHLTLSLALVVYSVKVIITD